MGPAAAFQAASLCPAVPPEGTSSRCALGTGSGRHLRVSHPRGSVAERAGSRHTRVVPLPRQEVSAALIPVSWASGGVCTTSKAPGTHKFTCQPPFSSGHGWLAGRWPTRMILVPSRPPQGADPACSLAPERLDPLTEGWVSADCRALQGDGEALGAGGGVHLGSRVRVGGAGSGPCGISRSNVQSGQSVF